jgi:hypothetical protein
LQQQDQQADLAVKEVAADAPSGNAAPASAPAADASPAAPPTVTLGQNFSQVEGIMGAPKRIAQLGSKVVFYYNGMKVVFQNGKVSDVQ